MQRKGTTQRNENAIYSRFSQIQTWVDLSNFIVIKNNFFFVELVFSVSFKSEINDFFVVCRPKLNSFFFFLEMPFCVSQHALSTLNVIGGECLYDSPFFVWYFLPLSSFQTVHLALFFVAKAAVATATATEATAAAAIQMHLTLSQLKCEKWCNTKAKWLTKRKKGRERRQPTVDKCVITSETNSIA